MTTASEVEKALGDETLNAVHGHTRLGTLVATAFAVFMALQLRGGVLPDRLIFAWLGAKILVAGVRIALNLRHERLGRPAARPGATRPTPGCWPTAWSGAWPGCC